MLTQTLSDNYIGIEEASKYLDLRAATIRMWIKNKDFPAHKIGKLWKFKRCEIDVWIEKNNEHASLQEKE